MEFPTWLTEPLTTYDKTFYSSEIAPNCEHNFEDYIKRCLSESSASIPFVTKETLPYIPDGHLVCAQGMVQDMFDSELYMSSYRLVGESSSRKSTRYRDVEYLKKDMTLDENSITLANRQSFFISNVPDESPWIHAAKPSNLYLPSASTGTKRTRDDKSETSPPFKKLLPSVVESSHPSKKPNVSDKSDGIILRVYNDKDADGLKLTDLVFVYGILEHARLGTELFSSTEEGNTDPSELETTVHTKKSHLPRVHAIVLQRASYLSHPWLQNKWTPIDSIGWVFSTARCKLVSLLSSVLGGDNLAAEFTLLYLLSTSSKSTSPYPSTMPCLNISNWNTKPGLDSESFMHLLENVLPQLSLISLTIDELNSGPLFMPVRDVSTGELESGLLQLPTGSQILVDETRMTAGQLSSRGLLNFRALSLLATQRKLTYDFQFYTQDWDADIRVILLSNCSSIIKPVYTVPCKLSTANETTSNASDEDLWLIRRFIFEAQLLARKYLIDDELQEIINQDFVNWRKGKETFIEAEDFAVMLCLLKLYTLSLGITCPNSEHWQRIVSMECERHSRLKSN